MMERRVGGQGTFDELRHVLDLTFSVHVRHGYRYSCTEPLRPWVTYSVA